MPRHFSSGLDIVRQFVKDFDFDEAKNKTKETTNEVYSFSKITLKKIKSLEKEDIKKLFTKDSFDYLYQLFNKIETKQKIIFSLVLISIAGLFGIIRHNQNTMIPDAVFRKSVLSVWEYTSDTNLSGMKTRLKNEKSSLTVQVSREKSQIEFNLPLDNPSLKVTDNVATYTNEDESIEVKYEIFPTKLKESIILNSPAAKPEFVSSFLVQNLIVKMNNENIPVFFDTKDNYQFHLERPFATDAAGETTFDLVYQLKPKSTNIKNNPFKKKTYVPGENLLEMESLSDMQVNTNEYELVVSINPAWLNSPERQYPIVIDPTITHDTTADFAVGSFNRLIDTGSGSSPVLETYYQESIADEYTMALWHMNEASGITVTDDSGNSNTGTTTGTTVVDGKLSNARSFNGSSDYISISDSPSLSVTGTTLTIEAWFNPTILDGTPRRIAHKRYNTSSSGYELAINASNKVNFILYDGTNICQIATPNAIATNTWYHAAGVFSGSTCNLYLNGQLVGSSTGSVTLADTTEPFRIGSWDGSIQFFAGSIDEVHISKVARTPEEIKAAASRSPYSIYTSGVINLVGSATVWDPLIWTEGGVATGDGETLFSSTGLVAQWNFNETSGTTADNAEGTATLDGTLSGFDSTASQDADPDSGWTANNRRWGVGSLQFDGINSVVSIGAGKLDSLTTASIETWINYSGDFPTNQVFFSRYKDGSNRMPIFVSSSTEKIAFENIVGGSNRAIYSDAQIIPGKWYHLAFICGTNGMKMYVNGIQQADTNATTDCFSSIASTVSNDIGAHNGGAFFPGSIDSTRIYSRELTAAEILSNYNSSNIEIQTRVGHLSSPSSGTWEDWSPTTGETAIDDMDDYPLTGCTATGGTPIDGGRAFMFTKTDRAVYQFTDSDQKYTVPPGVTSIDVKMWGGGGGGGNAGGWTYGFTGGGGGYTEGTLTVTPGQVLTVMVGEGGTNGSIANTLPSYGGGGRSCNTGSDCRYGGQGGGRSAIRTGSSDIITAGGGGGGGSSRAANGQQGGGGGGNSGVTGTSYTAACGGVGGTQTAGGAGGTCANANGTAGSQYTGGNPASNAYGGGGGGGYFGGGGGGYGEPNNMGGGGGGAGYIGGAGGVTVSGGITTAASGATPGNSSDPDNARTGTGGAAAGNGAPGRVVITPQYNMEFECTSSGEVEVLVVAGGGGGGMDMGGGGGGGGVIHDKSYSITANTPVSVTVGAGGVGAPAAKSYGQPDYHQFFIPATNGDNSVFGTLTAIGGGRGGSSYYGHILGGTPGNGGSGGGASGYSSGGTKAGGTGTAGQGFAGGQGGGQYYSGGGGGAGGAGTNSTSTAHGGIGYYSDILGPGYYWGGGGGGAGYSICGGNGGAGGAGGGGTCTSSGGSGLNNGSPGGGGSINSQTNKAGGDAGVNTGGGGGGSSHYNVDNKGGEGGSGIIIVRLSPASKDTNIKAEGTGSQKFSPNNSKADKSVVGLWRFEETGGTGSYIKDSKGFKTAIYSYTGSDQTFVVPTGITSIDVEMWGGGGGGGNAGGWTYGYEGGNSGHTTGTLAVTPGQSLTVMVGAGGTNGSIVNTNPSYGGGGRSCNTGSDCRYGGQGGGRSAIRISSSDIITAGGGGGGGASRATYGSEGGSGGGWSGTNGTSYTVYPNDCGGRGGTETAGGAGGVCGNANGSAGSQYTGGNPASNSYGGGGGGGYFGGGGGGYGESNDMGGGGGGSGYMGGAGGITVSDGTLSAGASINGFGVGGAASANGSNGKVEISWDTSDGNHGTPTGTTVINGVSGKARSFNGSSDGIAQPSASNANVTGDITVEAWIKPTSFAAAGSPIHKDYQYSFNISTSGTVSWADSSNWSYANFGYTNIGLVAGKWQHIAFTKTDGVVKIYLDGVQKSSKSFGSEITSTSNALNFGCYSGASVCGSQYFNGALDEIRISNVARTANEIAESYRAGRNQLLSTINLSSTNLSSKTSLPFWIAADRPGTYLESIIGESAYANYQSDDNTVGLWHLDEKSGSGAYFEDSTGNKNSGTPAGTTFTEGKIGKARSFNGTNQYINLGSNINLANSSFTADAWVKRGVIGVNHVILGQGPYGTDTSLHFGFRNTNVFMCAFYGDDLNTTETFIDTDWHLWTCTYDSSTNSRKLYQDGKLIAQDTASGDYQGTGTFYIGSDGGGGSDFNGLVDEVRISDTVRTASEIRQAYEVGLRSHPITIDFAASGDAGNLINDSSDTSFAIDATTYGLSSKGSSLYKEDKIIVKENYDGTEYIAQGTVTSVTALSGAVAVASWDSGSTFPAGGFTANADFFKWQREYWPLAENTLSTFMDGITNLSIRQTNGHEGRTIWLDDFRSNGSYLTTPGGSTLTSILGRQFLQYRSIFTSTDPFVSAELSSISFASDIGPTPVFTPTPLPVHNGEATGASNCYLEESPHDDMVTLHWTDGATDEIGYEIEKQTNSEEWQTLKITSSNVEKYNDDAVSAGNIYRYRVRTRLDDNGTGEWCGTGIINMNTGNSQLEGLKIEGIKLD